MEHTADLPALNERRVGAPEWAPKRKEAKLRFYVYLLPFGPTAEALAFVRADTALGRGKETGFWVKTA